MAPVLDFLRGSFVYIVAFLLPLAGAVLAIVRFSTGEREEGLRVAAAAVLGTCVLGIIFL